MNGQRFPFLRLPDNLRSEVLKTMEYQEMIFYSLLSKKALSTIKALQLPIRHVEISMRAPVKIFLQFKGSEVGFKFIMPRNYRHYRTNLNDLPANVIVMEQHRRRSFHITMGNQGMTLGEWINGLSLIPDDAKDLIVDFFVGHIMSDIQLLKNIFPKRMSINITCEKEDPNEQDTLNAQNLLRAFIPDVQRIKLFRVPLEKNFSRQHIGMANLKELGLFYQVDLNLDEICSWNVENCTISTMTDRMSLRDLNRFFKLWIKGSNPKLRELSIHWKTEIIPDWNVLLRGLKAVETEAEEEEERKFTIRNIRGICAVIQIEYDEERARAVCTFSN